MQMSEAVEIHEDRSGFSRRRVLQTAAWAAPAIVVATAAPAAAASANASLTGGQIWVEQKSDSAADLFITAGLVGVELNDLITVTGTVLFDPETTVHFRTGSTTGWNFTDNAVGPGTNQGKTWVATQTYTGGDLTLSGALVRVAAGSDDDPYDVTYLNGKQLSVTITADGITLGTLVLTFSGLTVPYAA